MKRILIISLFLSLIASADAQKVGLVLSGGGAKGLYHVGIIKALEENNVPIDYVSGASMGAIVGAMYAIGWTPQRMWNFFLTDSVGTWLSGKIPDQYRYYYRQFAPTPKMVGIKINPDTTVNKAFQLPTNLIAPYLIDLAMMDMLSPAQQAAGNNFDSLMVPFRCVASDMSSRRSVVFRNGSLPYAIRASMTIPLVFKPLSYQDSLLLYDGGVLNNFPFQVLQDDFQPDILIGGICTGNVKNPSADNIVGQINMLMTERTNYNLPDSLDITIKRRFPEVGMLEYSKALYVMQAGYQDAMAQMPLILEKIGRRVSSQDMEERRSEFTSKQHRVIFEDIDIDGLTPQQTSYVRRQLGLHLHKHFTYDYFYEKYLHLLSAGVFSGEFPGVEFNPTTNCYRLKLKLKTQPSLGFALGGNISSGSLNQIYAGLDYQRVSSNVGTYGLQGYFGFFYNAVQLGARHDMYTNFPFYIDYSLVYETYDWDTNNSSRYYSNKQWRFKNQQNAYATTSIAVPVLGNSAFRARLSGGVSNFSYFQNLYTSIDKPSGTQFGYGNLTVEVETNSMNYPLYEDQGTKEFFSAQYTLGSEHFTPGTLDIYSKNPSRHKRRWFTARYMREQYFKSSGWFTLGYLVDAVVSDHPSFENSLITSITAPYFAPTPHASSLFMNEFSSQGYLGLGLMPVFNFVKNRTFYLKTYAFAFLPKELIYQNHKWQRPTLKHFDKTVNYIFGGSFVYQSLIGPASLTLVKYTTGRRNWNLVFNFGYTLFNKRRY